MKHITLTRVAIAGAAGAALAAFSLVSLRPSGRADHAHEDELLASADVIYADGTIITVNDAQPTAEAVALKDGRILAVGSKADVMRHQDDGTQVIDLRGRTMVPGFIDGHSHITRFVAFWGLPDLASPPVGNVSTIDDMIARLRNYVADHSVPPGQAVIGYNYDQTQWHDQRHPSAADLDRVSTEHPVVIFHVSGDLAVGNHVALQRIRVLQRARGAASERSARLTRSRLPDGMVQGRALEALFALLPSRTQDQQLARLDQVQRFYASHGITTAADGSTEPAALALLRSAAENGRLILDIVAHATWSAADSAVAVPERTRNYANQLRIAGVKINADGWLEEKAAFLTQPYLRAPGGEAASYRGHALMTQAELNQRINRAYRSGQQVLVHCNGDACADMMIAAVREAQAQHGWKDLRPVLVHGHVLRDDQLDAMKSLGIVPSFFTTATYYWGDRDIKDTLGRERSMQLSPIAAALRRGLRATNHTDAPATPPDQIFLMHSAVNRASRTGVVMGAGQRISPMDALRAITSNGAYLYFEEASKGTIEPGKRADLVVLSGNPLAVARDAIKDIRVLKTIKDGLLIYDATSGSVLATR